MCECGLPGCIVPATMLVGCLRQLFVTLPLQEFPASQTAEHPRAPQPSHALPPGAVHHQPAHLVPPVQQGEH